jgi:hypothetical protein
MDEATDRNDRDHVCTSIGQRDGGALGARA